MNNDDITLTIQKGGMHEFEKTGVYPEYLIFHSGKLKKSWRIKQKQKNQAGVLRYGREVVYNYMIRDEICKIQSVENGVPVSDWIEVENVMFMLCD
jgi:hypothetical protein